MFVVRENKTPGPHDMDMNTCHYRKWYTTVHWDQGTKHGITFITTLYFQKWSNWLLDCGNNMQATRFGCTWWCSILFFCSMLPVQVCCGIQH